MVTEKAKVTPLAVFLSKSGYKADEISAYNETTRVFATWNGGKYHLVKNGGIRILKGPAYPKLETPTQE